LDPEKSGFFSFREWERNDKEARKGEKTYRKAPVEQARDNIYAILRRNPRKRDAPGGIFVFFFASGPLGYR